MASVPVTGYTYTNPRPASFVGSWLGKPPTVECESRVRSRWVPDKIVLLMVDYHLDYSDPRLTTVVSDLQAAVKVAYEINDCPETEFWIVTQQVFRQA